MNKSICPYRPHGMSGVEKANGDPEKVRKELVYEVFQTTGEKPFAEFLAEIGLEDLGLKESVDSKYQRMWRKVKGSEDSRFLLYPAGAYENRLYDDKQNDGHDDDMPDEMKKFTKGEFGEIDVVLEYVSQSQDYSFEEISLLGYENDHTYSYDIIDKISDASLYTIRPCCPVCRTLLPDNWFSDIVKEYIPIVLIGEKSSGKTTYMSSLLGREFLDLLRGFGSIQWSAYSAIEEEEIRFKIQEIRYGNLKRLLEEGKYPEPTTMVMPPVCINISKNINGTCNQIIVAVFDCDGELFTRNVTREELKFLLNMQAYIYLVEPKQMSELDYRFMDENSEFTPDLIKPIDEQGTIQKDNIGNRISASDIIQNAYKKEKPEDPVEMLIKIKRILSNRGSCLKHIAYTIVKSDELLKYPEKIEQITGIKDILNQNGSCSVLESEYFEPIDDIIKEFFEKIVFSPDVTKFNMSSFQDFGGNDVSKSWHCVSVAKDIPIGERRNNGKVCKFDPVRIVEPFVRCLMPKMKEMGWIDEDA